MAVKPGIASRYSDMQVVSEAADGRGLLSQIWTSTAGVLILDISMPGPGFLEVLGHLVKRRPSLRVLVLSVHPEGQFAIRALKAGAVGYVMKDRSSNELAEAIRRLDRGGRYVSADPAEKLVLELQPNADKAPHGRLSNREFEILCMPGAGRSFPHIADIDAASARRIDNRIENGFRKRPNCSSFSPACVW